MYNEIIFFKAFLSKRMLLNDKVEMFFFFSSYVFKQKNASEQGSNEHKLVALIY